MDELPLVSIIIPTFNSETTLKYTLDSIFAQTYKNFEVIIVDKNSMDNTEKVAKSYDVKFFNYLAQERSEQMNYGISLANGKYLYRIDSDFILDPSLIEEAVNTSIISNSDGIIIHNSSDPTISFWAKVRKLERDCYENDDLNVAVRFFHRRVLEKVEGFNENLIACEDYDFHNRILAQGFILNYIKSKEIHIGEPRTLKEVVTKHYYYGKSIKKYLKLYPKRGLKQLNPIRISYFRHSNQFLINPFILMGFLIYQFIRYSSAIMGYLSEEI